MPPGRSALLTPKCRAGDKVARPPQPLERARVFLGTGYPAIKASYGPQLAQLWVQELRIRSPSDLVHRCSPPGAWREATEGNLSRTKLECPLESIGECLRVLSQDGSRSLRHRAEHAWRSRRCLGVTAHRLPRPGFAAGSAASEPDRLGNRFRAPGQPRGALEKPAQRPLVLKQGMDGKTEPECPLD